MRRSMLSARWLSEKRLGSSRQNKSLHDLDSRAQPDESTWLKSPKCTGSIFRVGSKEWFVFRSRPITVCSIVPFSLQMRRFGKMVHTNSVYSMRTTNPHPMTRNCDILFSVSLRSFSMRIQIYFFINAKQVTTSKRCEIDYSCSGSWDMSDMSYII